MVAILKRWNGSSWVQTKAARYWNGSKWKSKTLKYWNGSIWVAAETKQPAAICDADIITRALWHFDEGAGNYCYDDSGNGLTINRVQYAQQPSWVSCLHYNGLYFSDDRINAPDHASLYDFSNSDDWQIDVIFKLSGTPSPTGYVFVGYYGGSTNCYWLAAAEHTGYLAFFLRDSAGNDEVVVGTSNLFDNNWHKGTCVRMHNGGTAYIKVYLDGNLQKSKVSSNTGNYNAPRLNIGWYDIEFPNLAMTGYIDEIRLIKGWFVC